MLKKNPVLWGSLIFLLVILNLWKLLPALRRTAQGSGISGGLRLDFPFARSESEKSVHRDLFALGSSPPASPRAHSKGNIAPRAVSSPVPAPKPSSASGTVVEISGGYRLMGVVSREGKSQALIGKGEQLFQVAPGDELEGRYRVQSIGENEVYLTEKVTGNNLRLRIWDQQGDKP